MDEDYFGSRGSLTSGSQQQPQQQPQQQQQAARGGGGGSRVALNIDADFSEPADADLAGSRTSLGSTGGGGMLGLKRWTTEENLSSASSEATHSSSLRILVFLTALAGCAGEAAAFSSPPDMMMAEE